MIELPNGEDYAIAIKFGMYDEDRLIEVLRYIEDNYEGITWWHGEKPTEYTPELTDRDEEYYADEIADFVLLIDKDNELDWDSGIYIDNEDNDYDYIVYTAEEFIGCGSIEEIELENEMDVSFLFN